LTPPILSHYNSISYNIASTPLLLHAPPKIKVVGTHHTSVILEVQENTVCSSPGLALSDNNCGHDLLPQLGLSLLDSRHDHISNTTSRQTVKTRTDTLDGDDVEISCTAVIAAVHDRTTVPPVSQTFSDPLLNPYSFSQT
jgi:hypothetical protein